MVRYSLIVSANVVKARLEVEIERREDNAMPEEVAVVYRGPDGWKVEFALSELTERNEPELSVAIERAKVLLAEHRNHDAEHPPDGLTDAGLAVWLLEKNNGPQA